MPVEIERKFLVDGDAWRTGASRPEYEYEYEIPTSERCFNSHPAAHPWREWPDATRAAR